MTTRLPSATDPTFTTVGQFADLQNRVKNAPAGAQIRVRGAMHSVRDAILTDPGATNAQNLILGSPFFTWVGASSANGAWVRAGGGIRLGADPVENVPETASLLYWMAHRNPQLSVPDLGGITHQSVGGFLSTGSSGGSLTYSFDDALQSITFLDGTGTQQTVSKGEDAFNAAGVSMGLFGPIVYVDIDPVPRFAIVGSESTSPSDQPPFDPLSPGSDGLAAFLGAQDYCRIMWWPQPKVHKWVTWTAKHTTLAPGFVPNPYQELGDPDDNPAKWPGNLGTLIGRIVDGLIDNWQALLALFEQVEDTIPGDVSDFIERAIAAYVTDGREGLIKLLTEAMDSEVQQVGVDLYFTLLGNRVKHPLGSKLFTDIFQDEATWEATWSPMIMNGIFLIQDSLKVKPGPQQFQDYGDSGLPMDNQISDLLMPTEFTELWIPIDKTAAVMQLLSTYYAQGYGATGTYACELYAAKASDFWLSPAYGTDVLRVDLFWFGHNGDSTPRDFYNPVWKLLQQNNIPFRPHWGKYLPDPTPPFGPTYFGKVYPRLGDFLEQRAKYDPKQLFVTDYWRNQLGIAKP